MELEQALASVLKEIDPIRDTERVPLRKAYGRIIAEDICAPFSVPAFPKSAMDGYAVRSEDVKAAAPEHPVRLAVLGEVLAGEPVRSYADGKNGGLSSDQNPAGTAFRIMTGAEVPEGYDAVVRQEDTDLGETVVEIYRGVAAYTNYCRVGEDIEKASVVLKAGRRIGGVEAGVLASLGISEVPVLRPPVVHIISTGTELMEVDEEMTPGRIYNSIAYMLEAFLQEKGFAAEHSICSDDAAGIGSRIREAAEKADVVITTGGVSVGKKDLLPEVLDSINAKRLFSRVNVQPGTPTIGSILDGRFILSLSGNPYAALANFNWYFWPAVSKLTGCSAFIPRKEEAVLQDEYPKINRQRRLIRARAEGGKVFLPAKNHASSVISNLLECNAYMDLAEGQTVKPGDTVKIIRFD